MKAIASISLLAIIFFTRLYFYTTSHDHTVGESITLIHTFLEDAKVNGSSQSFITDDFFVRMYSENRFRYGTSFKIDGVVENKIEDSRMWGLKVSKIEQVQVWYTPFLSSIASIRGHIITTFTSLLPSDEAGLLLGVVFGIKGEIGQKYYDQLQSTGVLHIVAASGSNVSVFLSFLLGILILILTRRVAIIISFILLSIYVVISGADPSIVRAAIMGMIVFSAQIFGRQNWGVYTLLLTTLLMLSFDPSLLYSIAFQLSVAATAGILYIKKYIDAFIHIPYLREDISTTFAAQIATLPIVVSTFGSYPLISLVSNLLVLWMVPILMLTGGAAALVSFIHPVCAVPFLYMSLPLLILFHAIISQLSHFSGNLTFEYIPFSFVIAYYLLLFGFIVGMRKTRNSNS